MPTPDILVLVTKITMLASPSKYRNLVAAMFQQCRRMAANRCCCVDGRHRTHHELMHSEMRLGTASLVSSLAPDAQSPASVDGFSSRYVQLTTDVDAQEPTFRWNRLLSRRGVRPTCGATSLQCFATRRGKRGTNSRTGCYSPGHGNFSSSTGAHGTSYPLLSPEPFTTIRSASP
jgi:hypothetical protein